MQERFEKLRDRNEALDISVLNLLGAKLMRLDKKTMQYGKSMQTKETNE